MRPSFLGSIVVAGAENNLEPERCVMTDAQSLLSILTGTTGPDLSGAIRDLIAEAPDRDLNRINALTFARSHGFDEEHAVTAFLHATRLGLFEMSWNVLCPGCGGVLGTGASLKSVDQCQYSCTLCAAGYEPTLDEMVEVTFTVSPRIRRIAAHDPHSLPMWDYARQFFWSSGVDLPKDFDAAIDDIVLDSVELQPGERALLSLSLPEGCVIIFDPITHTTLFLEVKGEPIRERQALSILFRDGQAQNESLPMHPGPLRLSLENSATQRVLPAVWLAGDKLHALFAHRIPFLTASAC
jgi:hypothetical protein